MAYIHVDVDLDEFDSDDLVAEVVRRMKRKHPNSRKSISTKDKDKIIEEFRKLVDALNFSPDTGIAIKSLEDKTKYEHFARVFGKYTSADIEKLLPE